MLSSGSKIDYEGENTYTVAVKSTDSGIPPLSYEVSTCDCSLL